MNIEKQFENLKNWTDQKKVILVEGNYEQGKSPIVEIPNSQENSIAIFKKMIESLNVKVIIYDMLHFDTDTFELYESTVDEMEDADIQSKFNQLKNLKNKTLGYSLFIFSEGMTFKFENYLEETSIFLEVQSDIFDYIEDDDLEDSHFKRITKEQATVLGKQLAEHENYSKLKSRTQRENLSMELFNSEFEKLSVESFYGAMTVVSYAEIYYETKIKPQREKELKLKINQLLQKGWTKVKVAAELGISKDTLNKYV